MITSWYPRPYQHWAQWFTSNEKWQKQGSGVISQIRVCKSCFCLRSSLSLSLRLFTQRAASCHAMRQPCGEAHTSVNELGCDSCCLPNQREPSDQPSALADTCTALSWDLEPEALREAMPGFLTHINCELTSACCFKQLTSGVMCYLSIDIKHTDQNVKQPKCPLPLPLPIGEGIKTWHISPLMEYCSAIERINYRPGWFGSVSG